MYKSDELYGKVRLNSYQPTQKAAKFLNIFQSVGWHNCNDLYHQIYENGGPGCLIIFTVAGKGCLRLSDKNYTLSAGTVAFIPPKTSMEYFTLEGNHWEFYWINVIGTYAIQTVSYIIDEHTPVFRIGNMADCLEKIKYLIFLEDDNKYRFEIEVSKKISELLHEIINELFFLPSSSLQRDSLPMKIAVYIEKHYSESINISKLCEEFFVSQNQLIRVFRREIGYTPYEYMKNYRLLKACELLQLTNYTINEIGALVGFQNRSNFIFQFRLKYGITPCSYRKLFFPLSTK